MFQMNLKQISTKDHFEVILSNVMLFIEATELLYFIFKKFKIEGWFPICRKKFVKVIPRDKSIDELQYLDENLKYKFKNIVL